MSAGDQSSDTDNSYNEYEWQDELVKYYELIKEERTENVESSSEFDQMERKAHRLVTENQVKDFDEAELAVTLMSLAFTDQDALEAATNCSDLDNAIAFLQQNCELCTEKYSIKKMVSMLKCTHRCCQGCAKNYFTIQITERTITDCVCPFCKEPDFNSGVTEEEKFDYFSNLDILLKGILDTAVHDLFQKKLRDETLMKNPNFKWCIQCPFGFIINPQQPFSICPKCHSITCSSCRKPWETQHEGISCEKFAEWKVANDPKNQAAGVAKHLAENGIDCPKCKFRYSLAKGGCIHFTCIQCKYEFCYGCGKPYRMGARCGIDVNCINQRLHAHHPRNCLFHLRTKRPEQLQNLLKLNRIKYETDLPIEQEENARAPLRCPVPIQKESRHRFVDTICSKQVVQGYAGLCRAHYVEYLVSLIKKHRVDPITIMDLNEIGHELRRKGKRMPEKAPHLNDKQYQDLCIRSVLQQVPLE